VKTVKPTGDANVPPHVERAHRIDDLMNEKAGSRDLDDEDIVDADPEVIEVSDSEEKASNSKSRKPAAKAEHTGPFACRPTANRISVDSSRTCTRNPSQDLLANISHALDPNARRTRTDDNSVNALQTGQIFTLSSQLRESQRQIDTLRNQLIEAERRCNGAERRADRAELKEMITESHGREAISWHPTSPICGPRFSARGRGSQRSHRRLRQEIYYAGGGRATQFIDSDDDQAEMQGDKDSPGTRRYTFEEGSSTSSPCSPLPTSRRDINATNAGIPVIMSPCHRSRSVSI
jgi:hypothetical protein